MKHHFPTGYTPAVPTLIAYVDGTEIFRSDGSWLYPLLEFERFLEDKTVTGRLATYDKIVGRASALLSVRLGVRSVRADILSRRAIPVLEEHNIEFFASRVEDKINCATEDLFLDIHDPEEAHTLILQRVDERIRRTKALVSARDLSVSISGRQILKGLDLEVASGELVLIRGENGAGKTTLLRSILGIIPHQSGELLVEGHRVGSRPWKRLRSRIAYVRQDDGATTLPISCREVVEIGAAAHSPKRVRRRAIEALGLVRGEHLAKRRFGTLSGGERRRVAIARALAQEPAMLLLDEPTAGLDRETRSSLVEFLNDMRQKSSPSVVLVSHELSTRDIPGARRLILWNGRLVEETR